MNTIIAAIDDSAAARPALATALALSPVLGAPVEALHVANGVGVTAHAAAQATGITLSCAKGDPLDYIADLAGKDEAVALVFGARTRPTGRHPAGHIAPALAGVIAKPVVIVPPEACSSRARAPALSADVVAQLVSGDLPMGDQTWTAATRNTGEALVCASIVGHVDVSDHAIISHMSCPLRLRSVRMDGSAG